MGSKIFFSTNAAADDDLRWTLRSCLSIRLFVIELDNDGGCWVVVDVVVVVVVKVSLSSEYWEISWNENCKNGSADLQIKRREREGYDVDEKVQVHSNIMHQHVMMMMMMRAMTVLWIQLTINAHSPILCWVNIKFSVYLLRRAWEHINIAILAARFKTSEISIADNIHFTSLSLKKK